MGFEGAARLQSCTSCRLRPTDDCKSYASILACVAYRSQADNLFMTFTGGYVRCYPSWDAGRQKQIDKFQYCADQTCLCEPLAC
jgi:hypothetical protein